MPPYVYYSRKNLNAVEVQFFDQSRAEAANKEIDTNLEKAFEVLKDFTIKKILITVPPKLVSSTTQRDTALDDNVVIPLNEAVIQVQVGDGPIQYYPVALCLGGPKAEAALAYTQATAADGSYGFMHLSNGAGFGGLDVEISWPAGVELKFFIKTVSVPAINPVTVYLIGEHSRR